MRFRNVLANRESEGKTILYSEYRKVEHIGKELWLAAMRLNKGTINSLPHLERIELLIDNMVPDDIKSTFSSSEIYVLLTAIFLHDIGKSALPEDRASTKPNINSEKDFHNIISCKIVTSHWTELGIVNSDFARYIAVVICAHCWNSCQKGEIYDLDEMIYKPNIKNKFLFEDDYVLSNINDEKRCINKCGLKTIYTPNHEILRLDLLAALLRIGDELENHSHRIVPDWILKYKKNKILESEKIESDSIESVYWRRHIFDVKFDTIGNCIILLTNFNVDDFFNSVFKSDIVEHTEVSNKNLLKALKLVDTVNSLISNWEKSLCEIGVFYKQVFLGISTPFLCLAGNTQYVTNNCVDEHGFLIHEPGLSTEIIQLIAQSAIRLQKGVVSRDKAKHFKWEELAAVAGIDNLELVKHCMYRLQSFSYLFTHAHKKNKEIIIKPLIDITCLEHLFEYTIIINEQYWLLDQFSNNCNASTSSKIQKQNNYNKQSNEFISTGLEELDFLLCPEITNYANEIVANCGFYVPSSKDGKSKKTPIIVVEGSSGDGKTILMNQIAVNLATGLNNFSEKNKNGILYSCIYFSLEQQPDRVLESIEGFKYFNVFNEPEKSQAMSVCEPSRLCIDMSAKGWNRINFHEGRGKIIFPTISPIVYPNKGNNDRDNFAVRFKDIRECVLWVRQHFRSNIFCFIDSLNALTSMPLTREQAQTLFSFFRRYEVPLMASLERQQHWAHKSEISHYNISRYLADVEISLDSNFYHEYFRQGIEIKKTRFNRRILGKHHMKIKSPNKTRTAEYDPRFGIVIYPSMHAVLSRENKLGHPKRVDIKEDYKKRKTDNINLQKL